MSNEPRFDAVKVKVCACASAQSDTNKINTQITLESISLASSFDYLDCTSIYFYFYSTPGPGVVFHIHSFTSIRCITYHVSQVPGYFAASNLLFAVHPPIWVTTRVFGIVVFVVRTSKDFNANTPSTSFNQHGQLLCSSINLCKITVF